MAEGTTNTTLIYEFLYRTTSDGGLILDENQRVIHLNPAAAAPSLAAYRTHFAPSQRDSEPRSMLALNVSCASTPDAAARAGSSAAAIYAAAARGNRLPRVPLAKDACDMLGGVPRRWRYEPGAWPATLHGTPDQLRADLSAIADEGGSDEIMVQDFIAEPEQRLESYSLLAEAFGLTPTEAADA